MVGHLLCVVSSYFLLIGDGLMILGFVSALLHAAQFFFEGCHLGIALLSLESDAFEFNCTGRIYFDCYFLHVIPCTRSRMVPFGSVVLCVR